jgi:hypothetical protein
MRSETVTCDYLLILHYRNRCIILSMVAKNSSPKKKRSPFVLLLALLGAGIVLVAAGFGFAATQESKDSFCSSCHTQPESTFYQRSQDAQATDLASAHHGKDVRCIDCHSGAGVSGRVQAELMGAHNAFKFFTGTAVQPAVLTKPIGDANCLKCHEKVTSEQANQNNHFHIFLTRWQTADPKAGSCVSCHSSHTTDGTVDIQFLNRDRTLAVCEACHASLGGGD